MDIALVIIFLALGILFFILEIFFLPGITIGGVAGTIFSVAGIWYAFAKIGVTAGWVSIGLGTLVFLVVLFIIIKSKTLDRISLNKDLGEAEPKYDMNVLKIGDVGKTLSRLAPMGKVLIKGKEYEAKSRDELIDQDMEIEIIKIDGQTIIVEQVKKQI